MLRMYSDLAAWWPLLSPPEDYEEEATFYGDTLVAAADGPCETLLELGSGGGNNASHLKARFRMTLVDPSPGMLAHSRTLNPEAEHLEGDMRTVRLGREFDRVLIQDAIMYMTTAEDLRRAIETAFVHCRPGGAALFCPDHLRETFEAGTEHGGHDGADRALRYLEWSWDPDPSDTTSLTEYVLVLREPDGRVHVEHDRHLEGVFSRDEWMQILADVGFEARRVPFDHSDLPSGSYELFLGIKPAG